MRTQVSCLYRFLPQPSIPLRSPQLPARPLRTPGDMVQACGAGQSLHSWQLAKQSTASRGPRDTKGKPHESTLPYNMPNTYNQSLERVTGRSQCSYLAPIPAHSETTQILVFLKHYCSLSGPVMVTQESASSAILMT